MLSARVGVVTMVLPTWYPAGARWILRKKSRMPALVGLVPRGSRMRKWLTKCCRRKRKRRRRRRRRSRRRRRRRRRRNLKVNDVPELFHTVLPMFYQFQLLPVNGRVLPGRWTWCCTLIGGCGRSPACLCTGAAWAPGCRWTATGAEGTVNQSINPTLFIEGFSYKQLQIKCLTRDTT